MARTIIQEQEANNKMDASSEEKRNLIEAMTKYMTECMSGHDPSHNPAHIHRVVSLAHRILAGETARYPDAAPQKYKSTIITLAAILHDIGDHKYLPPSVSAENLDPKKLVYQALIENGADKSLAERVQTIVNNVSYTNETKNPEKVRDLIAQPGYHELAIVQDADRLDAIGAVGIARTFTYLGTQGEKRKNLPPGHNAEPWELEESITHFGDKLEKLEGMMKTETGREIARERTRRLQEFKTWWFDETTSVNM